MTTSVKLEQLFWGNNGFGYGLLASTHADLNHIAEKLCQRIGTLDRNYDGTPILISQSFQDCLVMICAFPGKKDNYARKTLFFHALAVSREEAEQYRINAFSLYQAGLFRSELPGTLSPLILQDALPPLDLPAPMFQWDMKKLAIRCEKPENEAFCAILGEQINRCAWTTYSFTPNTEWDIYAITKESPLPQDRDCRSISGELLSTQSAKQENPSPIPSPAGGDKSRLPVLLLILLILSVGLNVFLFLNLQKRSVADKSPETENFDPSMVIKDLKTESENTSLNVYYNTSPDLAPLGTEQLVRKIEYYINFVNKHILQQKKGK